MLFAAERILFHRVGMGIVRECGPEGALSTRFPQFIHTPSAAHPGVVPRWCTAPSPGVVDTCAADP